MRIHGVATTTAVAVVAALCAVTPAGAASCVPIEPGRSRPLLARVPVLMTAQMTATRDGGAVIAFASYRGTREFPGRNFTVLALDASGCVRWHASLPGMWPIARPVEAGAGTILVASSGPSDPSAPATEGLRLRTLAASTGRVLRRDVFRSLASSTGRPPTLLSDRRGDVAVVLAAVEPSSSPRGATPVTLKLTRRAHTTHWSRQVLAHANGQPPAAAARSDGGMAVGYPRVGRFWVRTGTVAGRLGRPVDAGPIARNPGPSAVALGPDGTVAAVWQSGAYRRVWRLRAAVRPSTATRFARFRQLGLGTRFLAETSPAVRVGAGGEVTAGFVAPSASRGGRRLMCAQATSAGRFGAARQVALGGPFNILDQSPVLFGPVDSAAVVATVPNDTGSSTSLVGVDAGCAPRGSQTLDPDAGSPQQAVVDSRGRTWVLGQNLYGASISGRRDLLLTIAAPVG